MHAFSSASGSRGFGSRLWCERVKALLFLVGLVAALAVLFRFRGWHVEHYPRGARRAHFVVCAALAVIAGSAVVYMLQDTILCPSGYANADPVRNTENRKGGIKLICRDDDGVTADGSVFSGVFAWLGVFAWTFAGASAVWRGFGPMAPPRPAGPSIEPVLGTPTDRKEARRERNRAKRDAERRGGRR